MSCYRSYTSTVYSNITFVGHYDTMGIVLLAIAIGIAAFEENILVRGSIMNPEYVVCYCL